MRLDLRTLALLALCTPLPAAFAEPPGFDLALSLVADEEGGTSIDADASLSPTKWITLSAGAGTSDASTATADLGGTAVRAALDLHSQRFGIRPYLSSWSDESDFDSRTLGVRAYVNAGGFTASLIGERQDLDVDFTVLAFGRPVPRSASFEATGFGGGLAWYGERWSAYVEGLAFDYDDRFDALVATARSPAVDRFPRIEALVGSILTLTQGALDHEISVGVARAFSRTTLSLDWVGVEDAIDGMRAQSVSGTWSRAMTGFVDLQISLGVVDSEGADSLAYGGVGLQLHR